MTRTEKASTIEGLRHKLGRAQSLVLADFRGLTVEADTKVRNEFRSNGCEYRVVKNALLGRAVQGTVFERLAELLAGPTAIAYSFDDPASPAKVATRIAKQEGQFVIKGGYLEGRALDTKDVEALAALPSPQEAKATLLATFLAVPQSFLRLTTAAQQGLLLVLAARERALGEAEGDLTEAPA